MGQKAGFEIRSRNTLGIGYKNTPNSIPGGTWTTDSYTYNSSQYSFGNSSIDYNVKTYFFNGYIFGFRAWDHARTSTQLINNKGIIIESVLSGGLIAAVIGDDLDYKNNSGNLSTIKADSTPPDYIAIWTGDANNTNWNNANNWEDDETPNTTNAQQDIQIKVTSNGKYPEIDSHITDTGNITIDANASITIKSGGTLNATLDFINSGTVTVKTGGSLILQKKQTTESTGTFNIEKTTPTYNSNEFFSYWSSPVVAAESNISTVFPDAEVIYSFGASSTESTWVSHGTSNFEPGLGYAVQNEGNGGQVRIFTGMINNGTIAVNVYNTTNKTGTDNSGVAWSEGGDNLVGNPYPAAIDWDKVINDPDNSSIDGTMYVWDQTSAEYGYNNISDYKQYNLTGGVDNTTSNIISSGQGFFIRTTADSQITFKTSHQIAGSNTSFYRTASTTINKKEQGRSWFTFKKENKVNTLLVGFIQGATDNYDRLYDAPFDTNETSLGFYSLLENNEKASIQGLSELTVNEKTVKLGYLVDQIGEYNIGIQAEYIDENYNIFLKDSENDVTVDLRETDYTFNINTIGENNSRFTLIYKEQNNLSQEDYTIDQTKNHLLAYVNTNKELVVDYNSESESVKEISVYNIYGNNVAQFTNKPINDVSNLVNGIYILKATLTNNAIIAKKIIIAN